MGLTLKTLPDIFNKMVVNITTNTDKLTDFNVGSALRTTTESVALQVEEFYFDMRNYIQYAVRNSVFNSFGFTKVKSKAATGLVTVIFNNATTSAYLIPKGTLFSTSTAYNRVIYFESYEDVWTEIGVSEVSVPVQCQEKGSIGNVEADTIDTLITTNVNVKGVRNPLKFTTGSDEETTLQQKARFKNYINSLARGTRDAILYAVKSVDGVAGAWLDDTYIGFAIVYAHDVNGNLPDALKTSIDTALNEYRSAGIEIMVLPIVKVSEDITMSVILKAGYNVSDYTTAIYNLVIKYLNSFEVANNLYISNLINVVTENFKDMIVTVQITKGSDTSLQNNELVVAGTVSVTCTNVTTS